MKRVHGVGPVPCDLMLVGSEPGYHESQQGRPFVGRTGEELDRFLDGKRLPTREKVYLTNLYRTYKGKDGVQTAEDLARDELDLIAELQRVQPSLIVPMGREAARWFLGDIDIESVQGIAWKATLSLPSWSHLWWNGDIGATIFPLVHPASAFHNPEMASYVVAGFTALADYLDGKLEPRVLFDDPLAGRETYQLLKGDEVWAVLAAMKP